ncbi:YD repeat-containing protein [Anoxybacillus vitaminiphilus]|uniref:YD repeat-containing protein n=1 Tax=Paranoxybacillus vitaminiphilus TaxID=581036 RepID=A0A327YFM0_9BACL|nr:S-layer homology domain-containing protein [Anoxybacillus vitaminiphilus]RAK19858.1 YD repeat-containing protein [Anoxybacillus vitaminiphilus]
MAYQPKSYRKFLAGSVSAALVATAIGPVAANAASFSDVNPSDSHAANISALVELGYIKGFEDGTFKPYNSITRGQVAKIFARILKDAGFEVPADKQAFDDVPVNSADKELVEAAAIVKAAGVMTGSNGKLNPSANITREQMAKVLVEAFDLTKPDDFTSKITDLDKADASFRDYIQTLEANGVTVVTEYNPKGTVTRAAFASFVKRAMDASVGELAIESVTALDDTNRFLEITFNRAVSGLEPSDITVQNADTLAKYGVKEVKLSSNGKVATVELYSKEDADEVLEYLEDYIVKVNVDGKVLEATFNRPAYIKSVITDVDANERKFEIGDVNIEVPENVDFDFYNALGRETRVWFNQDLELVKYAFEDQKVVETSVKVTKEDEEVELASDGKKYDLASDFEFFLNGEADSLGAEGVKYDYAKVIFDKSGDVQTIVAYDDLDDYILTEKVEDTVVIGYDGDEVDLEDYLIVKDGKQISVSDIKEGDLVFFNEDAEEDGIAIVSNKSVSGKIENVFEDSFEIDGKTYDYESNDGLQAKYLSGDELKDLDSDAAEKLQAGGNVTVYFNWKGEVVVVKGTEGEVESAYTDAYTTDSILAYQDAKGNVRIELNVVNKDGKEKTYDFAVDSLDKVVVQTADDEVEYEVDEDAPSGFEIDEFGLGDDFDVDASGQTDAEFTIVAKSAGDEEEEVFEITDAPLLLGVATDEDGEVTGLKFYEAVETLEEDLESDDNYASAENGKSYRVTDDTVVVDVDTDATYPDAEDVSYTTWGELKKNGTDIPADSTIYYNEDGYVTHIVVSDLEASNTTEQTALIQRIDKNTDGEIVRIKALVNGESKVLAAENLKGSKVVTENGLFEGSVVVLEINDANGKVSKIVEDTDRIVTGYVDNVDFSKKEVTVLTGDGSYVTVALDSKVGEVYDATDEDGDDFSVEGIRDIEEGDAVVIGLSAEGSRFADAIVLVDADDLDEYGFDDTDTAPSINVTGVVDGHVYNDADPNLNIKVSITDAGRVDTKRVKLDGIDITSAATGTGYTVATDVANSGNHTLEIIATDGEGHTATQTITFTIDAVAPTVTPLGSGSAVTINQGETATITFSEPLSADSKTAVENALSAASANDGTYTWDAQGKVLTITGATGGTTYSTDVTVDVTDVAGNTASSLVIVNAE